jgi:hypothetical protein
VPTSVDNITFIEAFCNKCPASNTQCPNYHTICKYNAEARAIEVTAKHHMNGEPVIDLTCFPNLIFTAVKTPDLMGKYVHRTNIINKSTNALTIVDNNDCIETIKLDDKVYLTRVDSEGRRKFISSSV